MRDIHPSRPRTGLALGAALLAFPLLLNAQLAAPATTATAKSGIQWITMEQAQARAKKEPRPLLVDVYTQWCGPCKMLDRNTFSDPKVAAYVNRHFHPVKFDAESQAPVTFKGKKLENPDYKPELAGRRNGTHHLTYAIASVNGRIAYPTIVYLDHELNVLAPVQGYMTPQQMEPILTFFGEGHYTKTDYQSFMSGFKAQW
ncbi:MAG: thioredoxin family protein [Flavobacteriales bacterium]|jgi:thioredoxin-related protein|nr:thioredoxin family protein [Flavobacteriales bacterium]